MHAFLQQAVTLIEPHFAGAAHELSACAHQRLPFCQAIADKYVTLSQGAGASDALSGAWYLQPHAQWLRRPPELDRARARETPKDVAPPQGECPQCKLRLLSGAGAEAKLVATNRVKRRQFPGPGNA